MQPAHVLGKNDTPGVGAIQDLKQALDFDTNTTATG